MHHVCIIHACMHIYVYMCYTRMHACIYITHMYNRGKQEGEKERHEEGRKEEPKCERERWGENKRAKRGKREYRKE